VEGRAVLDTAYARRKIVTLWRGYQLSDLVIYLDLDKGDAATDQLLTQIKALPQVASADAHVEETERSVFGLDIAAITLTITTVSGGVGAASVLLDKIRDLIKSIRGVRQALVETPDGPKPLVPGPGV
jgi:hypothetical protein